MRHKTDEEIVERAKVLFPMMSEADIRSKMAEHADKVPKKVCCGACGGSGKGHSTSASSQTG